jgi:hypothetical protein
MFHPITTSAQVASHDAWLEEMRKEPTSRIGKPARVGVRGRLMIYLSNWLLSTGMRLQARYTIEIPPMPEAQARSNGVRAS